MSLDADGQTSVFLGGRYATTVRPQPFSSRFSFDGIAGDYCLVAFVESGDLTRYSVCSEPVQVDANGLVAVPPSGPRELRAAIYSPGVVALAWLPATEDGRVVAYRIRRDGVELERTDRHSLVERGVLYSPGVAEIFWERSPDHARLGGYDVSRDGERVAFHRGASHFEPRLPARASHTWSVVAVAADGVRSAPRRLRLIGNTFTPLDETASEALITRDSYAGLVAHAFDLYVGDLYNPLLFALENLNGLELVSQDSSGNPILDVYNCGDGRAGLALLYSGSNFGEIYDWTFESCLSDGIVLDGTLNLHEHYRGPSFRSPGLAMQSASGLGTTFSGAAHWWPIQSRGGDEIHSWETESLSLDTRTIDGDLAIENATSRFAYGYWPDSRFDATLDGTFAVRSDKTGGALMNASTPTGFTYTRTPEVTENAGNAWNFASGQLELVAEDGSRVLLDADSGDAATVRVTIDNEQGSDTFIAPWTPWQDHLRFDRYPLENLPTARPDVSNEPAITPDNHVALLDHVFALYAGTGYARPLALAQRIAAGDEATTTSTTDRGLRTDNLDCAGGGTATLSRIDDESDALTWIDGSGVETRFSGRAALVPGGDATDPCLWRTEAVNLMGLADESEVVLTTSGSSLHGVNVDTGQRFIRFDSPGTRFERRADGTGARLEGSLRVVSRASGRHDLRAVADRLTILTADGTVNSDGGFASGGLYIEAEDGSRLSLGDFVDSSEASIVIVNAEGRYVITTPWVPSRSALDSVDDVLCEGF